MGALGSELRVFLLRIGTIRSILLHLALLAAFGFWVPQAKGVDFFDSQVLAAYACLGLIFGPSATAQSFAQELSSTFQTAIARVWIGVLYGESIALALLGGGIATVYSLNRGGFIPSPDWPTVARSAMFGASATLMFCLLAAWLTVRFSRTMALTGLRVLFFGLLVLFYFRGQFLPDVGLTSATASLLVGAILFSLLRRAYR